MYVYIFFFEIFIYHAFIELTMIELRKSISFCCNKCKKLIRANFNAISNISGCNRIRINMKSVQSIWQMSNQRLLTFIFSRRSTLIQEQSTISWNYHHWRWYTTVWRFCFFFKLFLSFSTHFYLMILGSLEYPCLWLKTFYNISPSVN